MMTTWATLEPDAIRAAIGNDRAKARACVAALAVAASDPTIDPVALRAKIAVARAVLTPPAAYGGRSGPEGRALARLIFCCPGAQAFEALDVRFHRKQIVYEGRFVHPADGSEVTFSAARLEAIARETNRYLNAVGRIPFPDGHRWDAVSNLGWWWSVEFEASTNSLYGVVEVTSAVARAKIGGDIRDVSMVLSPEESDSFGNVYRDVITHVCATSYPVIPDQRGFEPLELGRDGATHDAIYVPIAFSRHPNQEDSMQVTEATLKALGLEKTAKPEEVEAAVLKLGKPAGSPPAAPAAPATGSTADPRLMELERKHAAQAEELARATKALKDRDDADLQALVDETKKAASDSGVPTAFGADQEKAVRTLWGVDKSQARVAAQGFAQAAGKRAEASPGTKALDGAATKESQKRRDKLDTLGAISEQQGRRVEWSADRKKLTVHPLAHERSRDPNAKPVVYEV